MHQLIETERLNLRILCASDVDVVLEYYEKNRSFLKPWEPLRPDGFYCKEMQTMSLKLDSTSMERGEMVRYWLFTKDTNQLIGTVALTNIIRGVFKSCFMGYKLSQGYVGMGYMSEALEKIIVLAFEEMKLHRIEANIMPRNAASIKLINKLGFKEEGISLKYLKINGKWEDHSRYALINEHLIE